MTKNKMQQGSIIYHPEYGFGIMKDLPTFGGMQVIGIRNSCFPADEFLKQYGKYSAIQFKEFCDNHPSTALKNEQPFQTLIPIPSTEQLFDLFIKSKPKL